MLDTDSVHTHKFPNVPNGFDVWKELGVAHGASTQDVDSAWKKLPPSKRNVNTHFAWKLLRDPAYAALYEDQRNVPALYDAGFFVDRLDTDDTKALVVSEHDLTTPFDVIAHNMDGADYTTSRPVVLLTTGGFSPIHWGHLSMMKTAKRALEEQGRHVVGGYVSLSHDDYVGEKYNGEAKLSAEHRMHLVHEAVDQAEFRDWLMVDPFESQYVSSDVNFTDVIRHIKTYLERHVDARGFDVVYVSGADNAGFVDVLRYCDGGVIVSRGEKHNGLPEIFERPEIASDPRLLFVRSEDPASEFSSSSVRRWKPQQMPSTASQTYTHWRVNMMRTDLAASRPPRSYMVRDDGAWAMQQFFPDGPPYQVIEQLERFKAGLSAAVVDAFANVGDPDEPRRVNVHYLPLGEQRDFADSLSADHNVLNLDVCTNGEGGINFSRLFPVSDGQLHPSDLVARPGFDDVQTQIDALAPGDYILLDDDIASGSTVNHLMGLLPEEVKVTGIQTIFNHSCRLHRELVDHEVSDMIDLRDFIIGSHASGLVVTAPDGDVARAPYMLPFVSPHSRATIPLSSMREFSRQCWKLNAELFESIGDSLTLEKTSPEFQTLMGSIGFSPDTKLSTIARHYEQLLARPTTKVVERSL